MEFGVGDPRTLDSAAVPRAGVEEAEVSVDEADEVKKHSRQQRLALEGEPKCAICGRYGEYICDETDDDICSLECKQVLLDRISAKDRGSVSNRIAMPATDECFYVRDSMSLTPNQTELLRKKLDIHVKGDDSVPPPVLSFSAYNLPSKLLQNLESSGFDLPTPVQMQAIPIALTGKSLLASASTGSGKTASFLVPIICHCANFRAARQNPNLKKPLSIVLTPTRELCIQVEDQAKLLGKGLPFKTALVVGGDPMAGQVHRLHQGIELIVATPGRLIDLLTKHDMELDDVKMFVVDEVDLMLQSGFRDQVMQIFTSLAQPQVLMYSATISEAVKKLASSMVKQMVEVSIGRPGKPSMAVKQVAIWVETKQKKQKLFDILLSKQHFDPPAVVYVGSRIGADLLSNAITVSTGLKALSIHGEKPMKERREIMRVFLMGEAPVIVSTGVLGRGIDLLGVRQVIVFDMPNSIEEYVHMVGRASRMEEEGKAIALINEENKAIFAEFVDVLKSSGAVVPRELSNSRYSVKSLQKGKSWKKRKFGS